MKIVLAYARLYAHCMVKAFQGLRKNAWTLLLPMGLSVAMMMLIVPASNIPVLGGFLLGFVVGAAVSCYLYFTNEVVSHSRVSIKEFKTSMGKYFWSVLNLLFILWLASFVIRLLPPASKLQQAANLALVLFQAVLLNPAPEVIYLRGTYGGMETLSACIRFMQEGFVEWLIPNVILLGGGYALLLFVGAYLPAHGAWSIVLYALGGALLHVLMVFRGHLFKELNSSTHRQRMFRFRNSLSS